MQPTRRNLAVVLILANYGLAVTFGAWFHDHAGHAHHGAHHGAHYSTHHGCCCKHSSDRVACHHEHDGSDEPVLPLSGNDGDCTVCRFMAQKPASVDNVEEVASAPLVEAAALAEPVRRPKPVAALYHSRAPPVAG